MVARLFRSGLVARTRRATGSHAIRRWQRLDSTALINLVVVIAATMPHNIAALVAIVVADRRARSW